MKRHDPTRWPRAAHYAHFRGLDFPYAGLCAEVELTRVVGAARSASRSLFASCLHHLLAALHTVPQLRQRIRVEDGLEVVVEHEVLAAGITVPVAGDRFTYATVAYDPDVDAFAAEVARVSADRRAYEGLDANDAGTDAIVYASCLPWVRFTSVTHPMSTTRLDSVPRLTWGRLVERHGRVSAPVDLLAHHALVDGLHLGRFFGAAQAPRD